MNQAFIFNRDNHARRLHFIGIGGVGMSGIAEVMFHLGYTVSGSDMQESSMTLRLRDLGLKVAIGHRAEQVQDCDAVVVSSAVNEANPEVIAARALRIPVVRRAEMLAELMRFRHGIAVAGTHGKTTTTSLCASVLAEGGLEPTFVIGGKLNSAGTNAALGSGQYLVAEADESDASFLHLSPIISIVTNIDADHLETYGGSFERLQETFVQFLQQLPFYGLAVLCIDDPIVYKMLPQLSKPVLTYGLHPAADIRATEVKHNGPRTHFKVSNPEQKNTLEITLNMPGLHNVRNALAAIAVAWQLKVEESAIVHALEKFEGIGRRFQVLGDVAIADGKVLLVDDYGHHPQEMQATIEAVQASWPDKRLVVAFQPHRYTRTRDLFAEFVEVLSKLENLALLDVYPAGEPPIVGADGTSLYRALCASRPQAKQCQALFVEHPTRLNEALCSLLQPGDVLLTLGAGNIGALAAALPEHGII